MIFIFSFQQVVKFSENLANTLRINIGISQKMKKVFQKEILVVACRCVGFPFGVQAGCFLVFSSCCLASAIVSLFREFILRCWGIKKSAV